MVIASHVGISTSLLQAVPDRLTELPTTDTI